jgi:hypothetical protein
LVGWDVGDLKGLVVLDVVTKPVITDIDVLGTVLIDGVLEERESSLVITVECDPRSGNVDEWLQGV